MGMRYVMAAFESLKVHKGRGGKNFTDMRVPAADFRAGSGQVLFAKVVVPKLVDALIVARAGADGEKLADGKAPRLKFLMAGNHGYSFNTSHPDVSTVKRSSLGLMLHL